MHGTKSPIVEKCIKQVRKGVSKLYYLIYQNAVAELLPPLDHIAGVFYGL